MTQYLHFFETKYGLTQLKLQTGVRDSAAQNENVLYMLVHSMQHDEDITDGHTNKANTAEDLRYHSLKHDWCIHQLEWHGLERKRTILSPERHLLFHIFRQVDPQIPREQLRPLILSNILSIVGI